MENVGLLSIDENRIRSLLNPLPINDVYIVEQTPFARGKFAAVRKCRHRATGIEYAAKFIRKRRRQQDARHEILHEAAVLAMCEDCPRIVSLHEIFENNIEMVLVLELAAGGELQRLVDLEEGLEEHETIRLLRQILIGLEYLHARNIAHLDIKPQNILLTDVESSSDVKLCDFGISRVIQEGAEVREILGTPDYVAPEILSYDPISLGTDIWSIGVLAYVLLTGYSPFAGDTKQDTYCNISQCKVTFPKELFEDISDCAQDFISRALVKKPSNRMSVHECISHPWLATSPSPSHNLNCSTFPPICISCSSQSNAMCCEKMQRERERREADATEVLSRLNHHHVDLMLDRSIIC